MDSNDCVDYTSIGVYSLQAESDVAQTGKTGDNVLLRLPSRVPEPMLRQSRAFGITRTWQNWHPIRFRRPVIHGAPGLSICRCHHPCVPKNPGPGRLALTNLHLNRHIKPQRFRSARDAESQAGTAPNHTLQFLEAFYPEMSEVSNFEDPNNQMLPSPIPEQDQRRVPPHFPNTAKSLRVPL